MKEKQPMPLSDWLEMHGELPQPQWLRQEEKELLKRINVGKDRLVEVLGGLGNEKD